MMECKSESPSSSMDSSSHPVLSTTSSGCRPSTRRDLSIDLQLGLSLQSSSSLQQADSTPSSSRNQQPSDWPPIKPFLRSTLTDQIKANQRQRPTTSTFFVKVYMEGIPIGRKLDLLVLDGYDGLVTQLRRMFKTPISYPEVMDQVLPAKKLAHHVLTYEDQEGDWMMVGDVPWELFLTSVKKLRIARADKC